MATKFKMAAKIQDGRPKGVLIEILTYTGIIGWHLM